MKIRSYINKNESEEDSARYMQQVLRNRRNVIYKTVNITIMKMGTICGISKSLLICFLLNNGKLQGVKIICDKVVTCNSNSAQIKFCSVEGAAKIISVNQVVHSCGPTCQIGNRSSRSINCGYIGTTFWVRNHCNIRVSLCYLPNTKSQTTSESTSPHLSTTVSATDTSSDHSRVIISDGLTSESLLSAAYKNVTTRAIITTPSSHGTQQESYDLLSTIVGATAAFVCLFLLILVIILCRIRHVKSRDPEMPKKEFEQQSECYNSIPKLNDVEIMEVKHKKLNSTGAGLEHVYFSFESLRDSKGNDTDEYTTNSEFGDIYYNITDQNKSKVTAKNAIPDNEYDSCTLKEVRKVFVADPNYDTLGMAAQDINDNYCHTAGIQMKPVNNVFDYSHVNFKNIER